MNDVRIYIAFFSLFAVINSGCSSGPDRYIGAYTVMGLNDPAVLCVAIADRITSELCYDQSVERIGTELVNVDMRPRNDNSVYLIGVNSVGNGKVEITLLQLEPFETPDTIRVRETINMILNDLAPGKWVFNVFHNSMPW
jgi:hypothetical protein